MKELDDSQPAKSNDESIVTELAAGDNAGNLDKNARLTAELIANLIPSDKDFCSQRVPSHSELTTTNLYDKRSDHE